MIENLTKTRNTHKIQTLQQAVKNLIKTPLMIIKQIPPLLQNLTPRKIYLIKIMPPMMRLIKTNMKLYQQILTIQTHEIIKKAAKMRNLKLQIIQKTHAKILINLVIH